MANYQVETGFQLFARLNPCYNIENIYPQIIPMSGPKQREVIEILGDSSTGKTFMITEIIAKCLLPVSEDDVHIGGKNAGAVIINTDHHFHIFKLVQIMENMLQNCGTGSNILSSTKINDIINESIKNLIVLNCFDSQQLYVTIQSLENIVSNNNKLSLLILDSISVYYWADRLNGILKKMNMYEKSILKLIQNVTKEYNMTIIYTKNIGLSPKKDYTEECCKFPTLERINYRILLEKNLNENGFTAHVTLPDNTKVSKQYKIKELIEWEDSQNDIRVMNNSITIL